MDLRPGAVVAGYELETKLGSGGYGVVWRAIDLETGGHVAIKFLLTLDREAAIRFKREGRVLSRLKHPACVRLLKHAKTADGVTFLVMEYVDGVTLDAWMDEPRPQDEVLAVVQQIAASLRAAHRHGVVHRDLKPANVMLVDSPGGLQVKVLDFGIAKISGGYSQDITKSGVVLGTPGYMSPEQLMGRRGIGPATDQYCLGVILYRLLANEPPFWASTPLGICMLHLREPPPQLSPEIPERLRALVERLLQKEPGARYPSMDAVFRELEALTGRTEREAVRTTTTSNRSVVAMGVLALALALGAALFIGDRSSREAPPPSPAPSRLIDPASSRSNPAPADVPELVDDGCEQPAPGTQLLSVWDGLDKVSVLVHIPSTTTLKGAPLLAYLRDGGNTSTRDSLGLLVEFSERKGIPLVAPEAKRPPALARSWSSHYIPPAWNEILAVQSALCLDPEKLFILGEGAGSHAADRLACEYPDAIAAVAVTASRYLLEDEPCVSKRPRLLFSQLEDPGHPADGSATPCGGESATWPIADQQKLWRDRHGCKSGPQEQRFDNGTCRQWDCEVALEICDVEGGRHWPGSTPNPCGGPPADFPYHDVLWDFFTRVSP